MAGTFTVAGLSTGLLIGSRVVGPLTMQGSATVGAITDVALVVGDTSCDVPTGATAALIVLPPSAPVVAVRTNLNAADAGLPLGQSGWMVLPLRSGTSQLVFTAASASTLEVTFI